MTGNRREDDYLQEMRQANPEMAPNPSHPEACRVLHIERDPQVSKWIEQYYHWSKHGIGPGGTDPRMQPLLFRKAMLFLQAQIHAERKDREKEGMV